MIVGSILLVGVSLALPQSAAPLTPRPFVCSEALADAPTDGAAAEICAGEEAARLASAAPRESVERTRQWELAAGHYRKAATVATKPTMKVLALNLLVSSCDTPHLNDPRQMETALRAMISLAPDDLAPVFRLAKLEEDEGSIDAAEQTLLDARHQHPDVVGPNRMLAQFYARLVTALQKQGTTEPQAASAPGEPDENGVYRVGGSIARPARDLFGPRSLSRGFQFDDGPIYPREAQAAGIEGVVVAEVVLDESGDVTDAKVVQSIPLLDEAALQAVRYWHFAQTLVNGQPVSVRMNVNVNFSLPPTPARSTPHP